MKNIIIPVFTLLASSLSAQVILGDELGLARDKSSVLLEFSKRENRGIILPYITALPALPTEGTIILDATNATNAQVKYFNNTEWITLSQDGGNVSTHLAQQPSNITEKAGAATIIGANSSNADGVLVLESKTKAMVLPTVASTDDVVNPSPGMMVYVSNTSDKLLAVFNGANWSFWKAQ